ncbi:Bor/Iss family lipoprotein [Flammeovirga pacifica]|uniref:Lipoprotein n=1 Tax=Flammeovirga pacifica TaxID=915059 RepID=A0A1S1Z261_FLAPC|nr:hypothetical protein [Flammeovirga pacifica]OHX67195.1 hypothetical protein NH26_13020 [Flammeovirga pacifica]
MKKLIISLLVLFSLSSCYNTRLLVGNVEKTTPLEEVNKSWNHNLILGLVPLDNTYQKPQDFLPEGQKDYVVKTNQSFLNQLVTGLTLGIYSPTQTKYYVPKK